MYGKNHTKDRYVKHTDKAIDKNPKSGLLTEEQLKRIYENTSYLAEILHAQLQMAKSIAMFYNCIVAGQTDLFAQFPQLGRDPLFRSIKRIMHDIELDMAKLDTDVRAFCSQYSKLFYDKQAVEDDDTDYFSVLYDCLTLALGCKPNGTPLDDFQSGFGLYVVRQSYAKTLLDADPEAKNNIIQPYDRAVMEREGFKSKSA